MAKIKFPKSFKLFGTKVNVIEHTEVFTDHFRFLDGMADETNNSVHINLNSNINYTLNTLTHETVHLILYNLGLNNYSNDEILVHGLALGFNNWLLDNPEIRKLFDRVAKENNTDV